MVSAALWLPEAEAAPPDDEDGVHSKAYLAGDGVHSEAYLVGSLGHSPLLKSMVKLYKAQIQL